MGNIKSNEFSLNEFRQAAGGAIKQNDIWFDTIDDTGELIEINASLEVATFLASHKCPRCGKAFFTDTAITNHILAWDNGQG
ncbi:MAG: hypothetical protein IJV14_11715 [Lachnospiraceae bacterium]|nr:hypothetical protein [Lachnospiraceae bacterium]